MKHRFFALWVLCSISIDARAEETFSAMPFFAWGGAEIRGLNLENDYWNIDVSMPLPSASFLPELSYHRQAYEHRSSYAGWQGGDAHSIKARLPFGLTFEVGNRSNHSGFGDSDFATLSFSSSQLWRRNGSVQYDRLGADRGAPIPETLKADRAGSGFWRIAGSVALLAALSGGGGGSGGASQADAGNWQMVWNDEFDAQALDVTKWSSLDSYDRDECFGGGNNEQQCYTSSPDNVSISDGKLVLTARQESGLPQTRTYTSGRVQSKGKGDFTFGKIEARIKLPSGQGSWPAFWMLPTDRLYGGWPRSGEIDIVEAVNLGVNNESTVHGTIHYGTAHTFIGGGTELSDINAFHTYGVEWYPDEIRWFIDGNQYSRKTSNQWFSSGAPEDPNAPFDQNFHLILNLAIGGDWPGPSDDQNFPRRMEVDYVRVYQCGGDNPSACK